MNSAEKYIDLSDKIEALKKEQSQIEGRERNNVIYFLDGSKAIWDFDIEKFVLEGAPGLRITPWHDVWTP
jgi:hypothetical protein